jgi:hypothetical protein
VLFLQKWLYGKVYFYVVLQYFPTVAQSGKTISSKADERDMKYCEGAQLRMLSLCVAKKENDAVLLLLRSSHLLGAEFRECMSLFRA